MGSENNTIKFPARHTYAELQSFTNNFIGQTQHGKLYHATLPAVAEDVTVKILLKSQYHDDYVKLIDEILLLQHTKMICHPGLPKLIGYCHDGYDIGFIYSLKSLDTLQNLIPQDNFNWLQRMKVAIGFASILAHLHGQLPPIMIRNLDPAHIIVDQDYSPKLMEFSLISGGIFPDRTKSNRAFRLCYGYIEPAHDYRASGNVKHDVFAFGVILICLISKRAFEKRDDEQLINEWAEAEYRPNKSMFGLGQSKCSLVHQTLKDSPGYFHSDGYKITKLAMDCVNRERCFRPTMEEVVKSLLKLRVAREHGSSLGIQDLPSGFVHPSTKKGLFKKLIGA